MKSKAILLSSDSYAALHLIMTRFWPEFRDRAEQDIHWLKVNGTARLNSMSLFIRLDRLAVLMTIFDILSAVFLYS